MVEQDMRDYFFLFFSVYTYPPPVYTYPPPRKEVCLICCGSA
jgi:hypothetical protein